MSPNPGIFCQKVRIPAIFRILAQERQDGNGPRIVKKRGRELSVWSISPPWRAFSCGKNGISLLKEISFLPQRRKFPAAKKFSGVWKTGKNGASDGFFLLNGGRLRAKPLCPFATLSLHGLTRGRHPSALRSVAGGKSVAETAFRLSFRISGNSQDSHISVRSRPCVRPRDSRETGSDVLTK